MTQDAPEAAAGAAATGLTQDRILGGRLLLVQPRRGHRAGSDAVLLAAAVPARPGESVADFGAGVGTAGLAVLLRVPQTRAHLIEIDRETAALAERNISGNALEGRAVVHCADVAVIGVEDLGGQADHVLSNPPFNDATGRKPSSPDTARARVAPPDLLEDWVRAAARLVKPGGSLTMIHRPDALSALLGAFGSRFGSVSLRFIHPRLSEPAVRVLVQGWHGRRGRLEVLRPLMLHGEGGFTAEAEAIHRDIAPLI